MARFVDVENVPALFDEEFKKTKKLISKGETHLDNLAEGFMKADSVIRKLPTADVAEVKYGRWEDVQEDEDVYCPDIKTTVSLTRQTCSNCHQRIGFIGQKRWLLDGYCPKCGAIMENSMWDRRRANQLAKDALPDCGD